MELLPALFPAAAADWVGMVAKVGLREVAAVAALQAMAEMGQSAAVVGVVL